MATVQDINNEIDRIETAKEGIAEAIEEKGVEVPEGAKIQAFPALIRQIPTAVTEIFWAEYGVTSAAEIEQALTDGKLVCVWYSDRMYILQNTGESYYIFYSAQNNRVYYVLINRGSGNWGDGYYDLERTANKVTEINQDSDNTHYPSAKAVWDAMQNGKEVFIATYGTTTFADISSANSAGKVCIAIKSGDTKVYVLGDMQAASARFYITQGQYNYELRCSDQNVWFTGSTAFLRNSDKVDTIEGNETATNKIPSTKAVYDAIVANKQIFFATYGTTTLQEIKDADSAGKVVLCVYQKRVYCVSTIGTTYAYFDCISRGVNYFVLCATTWSAGTIVLENANENKVQTLSGNETSTTKYPSTKALADALGKMGVVSQTITWTNAPDGGSNYSLSNITTGIVPLYWIQLFTTLGATFNETTGYFELNGLTDLALDELLQMYKLYSPVVQCQQYYRASNLRTIFQQKGTSTISVGAFARDATHLINVPEFSSDGYNYITQFPSDVFYNCPNLKNCLCGIYRGNSDQNFFYHCYRLEEVRIYNLDRNIFFKDCPVLSIYSVYLMAWRAGNTTAITITLHADAFARCQADTTEYTYNGQTYTGVIAYAAAKNITIQSA